MRGVRAGNGVIGAGEVDPRRAAWAYLSAVASGPCPPLTALIEMVGVVEAARAVWEWDLPESLRNATAARRGEDNSARDLAWVARLGGRLVTPDDAEWPAWRMLSFARMDRSRGAGSDTGEPLALWVVGDAPVAELTDRSIAVVGTRAASPYGERVACDVVAGAATRGWTVVSGAAFGIDGAAHRAALAAGVPTIAVLACGVDRPYPAGHARLLQGIARAGLVVSEYPPGTPAAKSRFLVRNRLVAALSDAVVVVEAGRRSGARNTAGWSTRMGRPALAVPGSVFSATSVGCNQLIATGEALLVNGADDVFDLLAPDSGERARDCGRFGDNGRVGRSDELSDDESRVFHAVPVQGSRTPSEIARAAGIAVSDVRGLLPVLELRGYVSTDNSGWYRKVSKIRGDETGKLI